MLNIAEAKNPVSNWGAFNEATLPSGLRRERIITAEMRVYFVLVFLRINCLQRDHAGKTYFILGQVKLLESLACVCIF